MHQTKYSQLRASVQAAVGDNNLDKCFELLSESLDDTKSIYNDYLQLRGRFSGLLQIWSSGQISISDYNLTLNQIRVGVVNFVSLIKPEDVSLLRRINDKILIIACKDRPDEYWQDLFPEIWFSHREIIRYREEIPADFKNADVVIFDDLRGEHCKGSGREVFMREIAKALPKANLLYFGKPDGNPFHESDTEGDDLIFDRMGNANSRFTIHARLRELLEYRKIYGSGRTSSC